MFDYLIFDFDGTVSDSYPVLAKTFVRLQKEKNIPSDYDLVYAQLKRSVRYALDGYDFGMERKALKREFYRIYLEYMDELKPFPEAPEMLRFAYDAGKKIYLYTHSDKEATELLERWDLLKYFDFILDKSYGFPVKPAPDALNFLCEKCGIDREKALMIGDRDIDIDVGHNAGMKGCLFDFENYYPDCETDYRIDSLLRLKDII